MSAQVGATQAVSTVASSGTSLDAPTSSSTSVSAVEDAEALALAQQKKAVLHQLSVNSTFFREKGNKAFKRRNYDVAHDLYTKGIRHLPTSRLFCNRSIANLRMGKPQDAFLDASLAVRLSPTCVKAYVRRAAALQKLGRLEEAAEDLEKAGSFGNDQFVLKMLEDVRLCLSRLEGLPNPARGGNGGGGERVGAPSPASVSADLRRLEEVLASLDPSRADAPAVSRAMVEIQSLLEANEAGRDYFFACGGVAKVFGVFSVDNARALSIFRLICCGESGEEEDRARTPKRAHALMFQNETTAADFAMVLGCVPRKRLAVVSAALEVLDVMLGKQENREAFLEGDEAQSTVLNVVAMFAKGNEPLRIRAGAVLCRVANLKKFVSYGVRHHRDLGQGILRCCVARDGAAKATALAVLQRVRHSKAILSMLVGKDLGAGISALLHDAVASQDAGEGRVFASAAYTEDQLDQLANILEICTSLCLPRRPQGGQSVSKEFVTELSDKGTWTLVMRMMETSDGRIRGAATDLFASACRCLPELCFLVARDKDAFHAFFDVFADSSDRERQTLVSHIANVLGNIPEFHHLLSTRCPLGDLLKTLVTDATSDQAVVALCRILLCVTKNDEDFKDRLCWDVDLLQVRGRVSVFPSPSLKASNDSLACPLTEPPLSHDSQNQCLVRLWYARAGAAKFYALQLLQLLLSEERAARILTESASEGQVMVLIEDLNKHRILAEAQETGGASLFAPEAEDDLFVQEKARLVDQLDVEKLCEYLGTLAQPGRETVITEVCAASGTMLGARLLCSQIAGRMPSSPVYAVDWHRALVDRVAARAGSGRVYPTLCDYETIDRVPVASGLVVLAGLWQSLEDPPQMFLSIKAKLEQGGRLVLMERDGECLEDAKHWARKSGFERFAEPKHISGCCICVMGVRAGP